VFPMSQMGHYASQCPLKKKGKGMKQLQLGGTIAGVEEDPSQFETCLFHGLLFVL
jgi:hypothetical protein